MELLDRRSPFIIDDAPDRKKHRSRLPHCTRSSSPSPGLRAASSVSDPHQGEALPMADKNQPAAAVPVPVPVEDERRPLLALLVDVSKPPPPPPVAAGPWIMVVFMWGLLNAVVFIAVNIARYIILSLSPTPCTKLTWLFSCVTLTDEADTELWFLLCEELLCSAAAALAAPLYMLLLTTTSRPRWAVAVVHALALVALAATVGMHCIKVSIDHIILSADPGNTVHFFAFGYIGLAVDMLLAAVLLISCSPRRLQ